MDAFTNRLSTYVSTAREIADAVSGTVPIERTFSAGEDIIEAGNATGELFIVLEGWAIRYRSIEDGRRQILNFMLPGDLFDLQALGDLEADHSVSALETVRLLVFDSLGFLDVLRGSGSVATAFWWSAVQEESILREQIVRNGQLSAKERIGHLLLELQRRQSIADGRENPSFRLPVTRAEIADALGLTPVHVSRTFSSLKRMNLITEDRKCVHIIDKERLAKQSKFDPDYLHVNRLDLISRVPS